MKTSILLIDDNTDLAENIAEILEDLGVEVRLAMSADEALACFDERVWSLVVTDVRMPGRNGLELLDLLKQRSPGTPVLVMTGFADRDTVTRAFESGALAIVDKPLNLDAFVDFVGRVAVAEKPVLIVEDDISLIENLTDILGEERGVLPHPATSLARARQLATVVDFRVAIIDLRLPDGEGLDLARELRRRPDGSARPVIIITGHPEQLDSVGDDPDRSSQLTDLIVLTKPFLVPLLLERFREII
ncbi:Dna binding response regulator PrrA (RegA) [Enhygromyxa salina]|uniref:Dna binding response regulator PrrA (RegA) n=1 Tax=Enhygromyxa salina TaxID=215803 RepID=A0A0C2D6G5_9BACT|nr:response regulator [Enhygromyxa salina]KIG18746.1 Dna binding response regulator PrrA (RegA) [Enhygromyxa salina]